MKKKSTAEYAETAELILGKDKKYKSFYGCELLLAFRSSGDRDKRMNKEEAENAEFKQKKRNGIMERWNNEMVGNTIGLPIFQHSVIPIFHPFSLRAPRPLRLSFFYSTLQIPH